MHAFYRLRRGSTVQSHASASFSLPCRREKREKGDTLDHSRTQCRQPEASLGAGALPLPLGGHEIPRSFFSQLLPHLIGHHPTLLRVLLRRWRPIVLPARRSSISFSPSSFFSPLSDSHESPTSLINPYSIHHRARRASQHDPLHPSRRFCSSKHAERPLHRCINHSATFLGIIDLRSSVRYEVDVGEG